MLAVLLEASKSSVELLINAQFYGPRSFLNTPPIVTQLLTTEIIHILENHSKLL